MGTYTHPHFQKLSLVLIALIIGVAHQSIAEKVIIKRGDHRAPYGNDMLYPPNSQQNNGIILNQGYDVTVVKINKEEIKDPSTPTTNRTYKLNPKAVDGKIGTIAISLNRSSGEIDGFTNPVTHEEYRLVKIKKPVSTHSRHAAQY